MSKKKVLVTGLNGVVGTALRPSFEEKYELSSFSRHGCEDMPDERNHLGNLNDLESVTNAFKGQDTVVHLAADRSMKAEWDTVLPYNIVGLYNVFEAAKICGVKISPLNFTISLSGFINVCGLISNTSLTKTSPFWIIVSDFLLAATPHRDKNLLSLVLILKTIIYYQSLNMFPLLFLHEPKPLLQP